MADKSSIAWCDATWNPFRGCTRVSPGCQHCYAERMCARGLPGLKSPIDGDDFAERRHTGPHWTGRVELIEDALTIPMRWRKPRRVFVNSLSDTFHESVPDEWIDQVFVAMALSPQHTFIVCTKRIKRARQYGAGKLGHFVFQYGVNPAKTVSRIWPLHNVILLASVEDQARADERIPELLATPAAVRGISLEPMLGPVNLRRIEIKTNGSGGPVFLDALTGDACSVGGSWKHGKLDWVIVGGESGPGARPCNVEWIVDVVWQCWGASVPCFVKQVGENAVATISEILQYWPSGTRYWHYAPEGLHRLNLRSRAGADPTEWRGSLRVQEWPGVGQR